MLVQNYINVKGSYHKIENIYCEIKAKFQYMLPFTEKLSNFLLVSQFHLIESLIERQFF